MKIEDSTYMQADPVRPFMGLQNRICHDPAHFCACHHVWLSEADSQRRHCRAKRSDDGTCSRCTAFLEDQYDSGIEPLIRRTRVRTDRDKEREREKVRRRRRKRL